MIRAVAKFLTLFALLTSPVLGQGAPAQWNYSWQNNNAQALYPGQVAIPALGTASCLNITAGVIGAGTCLPTPGLVIGTTPIIGGTNGNVEYNNAGVLGEKPITGTGNVVLGTSPTIATPIVSGGTINNSAAYTNGTLARSSQFTDAIKCDGVTDDTAAIQAAIDALPSDGGTLILPQSQNPCIISSTITIGNGTSSSYSTTNGQYIIGGAYAVLGDEMSTGRGSTILKWTGASGGTAIQIAGPISGVHLDGIQIDCNSLCNTGFDLEHPTASTFERLSVTNQRGVAFIERAYSSSISGVAIGGGPNWFNEIKAVSPVSGTCASGMSIGPTTYGNGIDVARNTYNRMEMGWDGTAGCTGAFGVELRFIDNSIFNGLYTNHFFGSAGQGIYINPPSGSTQFPLEISMISSAIIGGVAINGTWTPIGSGATNGGLTFLPYSTSDGEPIPTATAANQFSGVTTGGFYFSSTDGTTQTGVNCSGSPTASFAAVGGIVTHC